MQVVTLVRREANRWRFWEATIDGPLVEVATGPLGSDGDAQHQQFSSAQAAFDWVEREVNERRAEGYVDPEPEQDVSALGPARAARNPELETELRADPDATNTYLVYADWLEAQGDPRGRLISLHHRLAQDPDNGELVRAENELLLHYADHFLPEHGPDSALVASWHMGFIRRAVVGDAVSLERVLAHPSAALLRELHIGGQIERAALVGALSGVERRTLRELRVSMDDGEPLDAAFWACLPNLESVIINGEGTLEHADSSHWRFLEITSGSPEISDDVITQLNTARWPRLTRLKVALLTARGPDRLERFLGGTATPALRELSVIAPPRLLPAITASALLGGLEVLRLRSCYLDDEDAIALRSRPARFAHLRVLDLSHNNLSPEIAASLAGLARNVVTTPQNDDDAADDDYYDDDYYGSDWDHYETNSEYSADVVPVYEKDPDEPEDETALAIDKTFQRGVVGFDHDD